jgi:hypothetical protein
VDRCAEYHYVKMVAMAADGNIRGCDDESRVREKHGTPSVPRLLLRPNSSGSNYFPTTQSPTTMWTLSGATV